MTKPARSSGSSAPPNLASLTSQFNVALMYLQGRGAAPDAEQAYYWFQVAASSGDHDAAARAAMIERQLGPAAKPVRARARTFSARPTLAEANGVIDQTWSSAEQLQASADNGPPQLAFSHRRDCRAPPEKPANGPASRRGNPSEIAARKPHRKHSNRQRRRRTPASPRARRPSRNNGDEPSRCVTPRARTDEDVPIFRRLLRLAPARCRKVEPKHAHFALASSAQTVRRFRIVIAFDPDPVGEIDHSREQIAVVEIKPGHRAPIMERIAKGNHHARLQRSHQRGEALQGTSAYRRAAACDLSARRRCPSPDADRTRPALRVRKATTPPPAMPSPRSPAIRRLTLSPLASSGRRARLAGAATRGFGFRFASDSIAMPAL